MNIPIKLLNKNASVPKRATEYAAGYDVSACISDEITIYPGGRTLIPTGISFALPECLVAMVCPRSGLAMKHGITVINAPGVIDADFNAEIGILLHNCGIEPYTVHPGDRIAQLVFTLHASPKWKFVDELPKTERGAGGFGSSGI